MGESTIALVVAMTIKIAKKTWTDTEITMTTTRASGLVKMIRKSIRSKSPLVAATTKRTTTKP
jgi:hypothetical protein